MGEVKEKKQEEKEAKAEKPSEDGKNPEDAPPSPPLPPPKEIVLRVFMHCEGCARKVKRCLKGFEGVDEVITDCKSSKVVVKGEKADPLKVLQRIQKKSHRHAELIISPAPQGDEPKKPEEKEAAVKVKPPSEKKEEYNHVVVVTVVLGIYMHCDACAQEIKKRIERMKGVENAEADVKSSQVTVKGAFEPEKLADYVFKKTGKHAAVLKVEPAKKIKEEKPEKEENKKPEEAEKKDDEENKSSGAKETHEVRTEAEAYDDPYYKLEMRRDDLYYNNNYNHPQNYNYYYQQQLYPQRFVQEMNAYPPQMFSDENPNACSVM